MSRNRVWRTVTGADVDRAWLGDRRSIAATCLSEALGTFALVFFSAGAVAVDAASGGAVTGVGAGIVSGLVVVAMVYALGHVSGAHINPVVTLAFRVTRRIGTLRALAYVAAQIVGCILAGLAIVAIVGDGGDAGATAPRIGGVDVALLSEIILTFFLALVILGVATDARAEGGFAGLAVGQLCGARHSCLGSHRERLDEPCSLPRSGHRRGRVEFALGLLGRSGRGVAPGSARLRAAARPPLSRK